MDIESPLWEEWEAQFMALATQAQKVTAGPDSAGIKGARHYLCLYGENGLSAEQEMAELTAMAQQPHQVKKVEVDTAYWQDVILFIP